jgi:hypothetical protein
MHLTVQPQSYQKNFQSTVPEKKDHLALILDFHIVLFL